ncbi:LacI family DNA-binding transcriptional regulator [Microbacterium thalassium]|uniref:LacI family DNA-binding transcriptional regulator n=1 Tax=Microbacterium TaxID=33882 RepID=UPI002948B758|nr:LacI family DNA-binding transcriptional regulator [Microbacterium thalassium]
MARVTIIDVAKRAGVSVASTSRALNGLVASAETIEKVRAAAAELGYAADVTARSLKLGRTQQLAYAVADIGNPVYVEMMSAIERVVAASDYRLVISSTGDVQATVDLVHSLGRGFVDGMVISPLRVTDELVAAIAQAPVPVVVLGRVPESAGVDTVRADSGRGMELVVDHLVGEGRRRLAFLNGPVDTTPGRFRQDGFRRAVADAAGVSTVEVGVDDFTIAEGYRGALELLEGKVAGEIDAIVAANDLIGIGALHAADDLGLRIPEDIAITGVDDTELAQVSRPGLTSVDLGAAERGRVAAELLIARLAEPERPLHTVTVAPSLRVRGSSVLGAIRSVTLASEREASA